MWVKSALFRTLVPARLVIIERASLCLGPATAALPEPFVEAMRRFHDRLPRLEGAAASRDADLDEAELDDLQFDEDGDDIAMTYDDLVDEDEFEQTSFEDPLDER
jgi:hypothetical protein